jgi:hypothetical protein
MAEPSRRVNSGSPPLLAAVPSPVGEEERWTEDPHAPHCAHTVDLTIC